MTEQTKAISVDEVTSQGAMELIKAIQAGDHDLYVKIRNAIPWELIDNISFWIGDYYLTELDRAAGWEPEPKADDQ